MTVTPHPALAARTVPGLHEFVGRIIERRFLRSARILDLGCGTGAFLAHLSGLGYGSLTGVDRCSADYAAGFPFVSADLDHAFADEVLASAGGAKFELVTAIELIEHLENPSHFLRECAKLLIPASGRLLLTSPNVESAPGRLKFLKSGRLRHFDEHGDPTHITPIFALLFERIARNNGYSIEEYLAGPHENGFTGSRFVTRLLARSIAAFVGGNRRGDCNLFLLRLT